jgi:hypothetical protein
MESNKQAIQSPNAVSELGTNKFSSAQGSVKSPGNASENIEISSVVVERGPITVDEVRASLKRNPDGSPNRETAQLRQMTIRHYPSGKIGNNLQDGLYDAEDFGFQDRKAESVRMAFIDVPVGTSREEVEAMLARHPDACIYQILSDKPILSNTQEQGIAAGLVTIDDIAFGRPGPDGLRKGGQVVRYGKSPNIPEGKTANDYVPSPAGNIQFRATFFSKTFKEDIDRRKRVASQGASNFNAEEASRITRTVTTRDQEMHEGGASATGSGAGVAERREAGNYVNDFQGTVTRGEQASGTHPLGAKPAFQAGFDVDNPDLISDEEREVIEGEDTGYDNTDTGSAGGNNPNAGNREEGPDGPSKSDV